MLIKEYRIPLPLTVDEYKIAQLYMIAKKSREESSGEGSGVEILVNEPYQDGPGGNGQYTKKIYHIGSHLPNWFKGLLPKSALTVEEEAWNAYPYTKTRFTSPFVEKFLLEIETYYFPDDGHQENVFQLSGGDLRNRNVDLIDVVKDVLYGNDYVKDEDPKLFISQKSGRGPLSENWIAEYWEEIRGHQMPHNGKSIMCAYKLCRVEFRYWGMQTKIEKFIHDIALRKTMLRAHRQAWAWQDEWHDLSMDDIREIERQTQLALKRKMGQEESDSEEETERTNGTAPQGSVAKALAATLGSIEKDDVPSPSSSKKQTDIPIIQTANSSGDQSPEDSPNEYSMNRLEENELKWKRSAKTEELGESSLAKWSSLDLLTEEDLETSPVTASTKNDDSIFSPSYLQRVASERGNRTMFQRGKGNSLDMSGPDSPTSSPAHLPCSTTVLLIVLHAGSVLDANVDMTAKKSDVTTFRGAFEAVMRQHYPTLVGHIAVRLVSCPSVCTEGLGILSSLSPYSFDMSPSCIDTTQITQDTIPIGAIPLLACSTTEYQDAVSKTIQAGNLAYQEFLRSEEGRGFSGQVCFVGDSVGSILGYDALCRALKYQSRHGSENSILDTDIVVYTDELQINETGDSKHLCAPSPRRRSSSTSDPCSQVKFEFEVSDFFMFGTPLALVLAYRKVSSTDDKSSITRPCAVQVYNMFHPTDPVAARLEPLLSARFSVLPPVNVARYAKYPLGNGQPFHLLETLQSNPQVFCEAGLAVQPRRLSEVSLQSTISGIIDNIPLQQINSLQQKWWGAKRLDYALYCPEGLSNFPTNALPHLFHASYWESFDVIAFILRQVGRFEGAALAGADDKEPCFTPGQPREKWIKKRTSVKLKNVAANHRANDVIVREGARQTLLARFMYGPLDMITLAGERVDIHVMKDAPAGEWTLLASEVTDKTGRVTYNIPDGKALGYGMYPIKMVVRGDHTCVDFFMAVVPPKTECVVFSIDGSFTASMSVTGRDPKVRAGAVDVVRHWQELGYLIIYTTGRPDMQQQKVVSWLSQHNFPHGLVSFADGLSTDPLGHKAAYLNNLVQNHGVIIHMAYGSSKDISVYSSIGLKPKQIYIVGKASKKQHGQASILMDGYAAHLANLMAHGGSRPAQGNARMVIPRGYFGLPGQNSSFRRRRSAKRATSYPISGEDNPLERSFSTRRCQLPRPTLTTIANHSSLASSSG